MSPTFSQPQLVKALISLRKSWMESREACRCYSVAKSAKKTVVVPIFESPPGSTVTNKSIEVF